MNTEKGAVEPRKVTEVDFREQGYALVAYADNSGAFNRGKYTLDVYRQMIADGEIDVNGAEFKTNAHQTQVLPVSVQPELNLDNPAEITGNLEKSDVPSLKRWEMMLSGLAVVGAFTTMFVFHPHYALVALAIVVVAYVGFRR